MTLNIHEPLIFEHDLFVWKNSSQVWGFREFLFLQTVWELVSLGNYIPQANPSKKSSAMSFRKASELRSYQNRLVSAKIVSRPEILAALVCTGNNFMHSHPHPLWFTAGGPGLRSIKMRDWNVNARITEIPERKKVFFVVFAVNRNIVTENQRIVIPNDCR